MFGRRLELVGSMDLQPTMDKVHNGIALDFAQYSLLREGADAKLYQLLGRLQGEPAAQAAHDLQTLQEACQQLAHLLQASCLTLRRLQLPPQDQRLAREALEGQLACMQACLRRSLGSFDAQA
ncbi:hypothetical protein F3J45_21080 [Pantoea sp. Ap-967]|uniref:hypothetical protein n=1 Tax=Pantoea sp. Ap-967 TaxID=2608362 RepID=UPI00142077B1|nr:hypothetical protein [Pantoea sp. Ap-967]NIE76938.1 hypothetical protein [Pantoea sp. Ap-967]